MAAKKQSSIGRRRNSSRVKRRDHGFDRVAIQRARNLALQMEPCGLALYGWDLRTKLLMSSLIMLQTGLLLRVSSVRTVKATLSISLTALVALKSVKRHPSDSTEQPS